MPKPSTGIVLHSSKFQSMSESKKFDEYRIHFRKLHSDMFNDAEANYAKKNELLEDILKANLEFTKGKKEKILKSLYTSLGESYHHFRIANKKVTKIEKDFKQSEIENEPSANVFIYTASSEQRILIESDKTSFNDSKAVANIIETALNRKFAKYRLALSITAEIEESEFWSLVNMYEGRITCIEFDFLYPNLPKSHTTITEELKEAFESIGAPKGSLQFQAEKNDTLKNINEDNEQIKNLNQAVSLQGQPVTIKVKNLKGKKKTGKQRKSISIEMSEKAFEKLLEFAKEIMKG